MIPVFRPMLPKADALLPYIRRIDESRWYSNFGPLYKEFQHRIALHFGLENDQVVLVSNATIGLSLAIKATQIQRKNAQCICPAWTFAATPHAIALAGLSPVFADVNDNDWTLSLDKLSSGDLDKASCLVVVSPFGGPVDLQKWETIVEQSGVPVVCDAAASFDAIGRIPRFTIGSIPIVISLHATKPLSTGEGAIILCTDPDLIERIRQTSNFGFSTTSVSQELGTNAKLSEYACAVGLASMDAWPDRRKHLASLLDTYKEKLLSINKLRQFNSADDIVTNYMIIETTGDAYKLSNFLLQRNIESRRWWRSGCHQHPAFSRYHTKPLPQTRKLGMHTLGIPFYPYIGVQTINDIISALREYHS